MMCLSVMACVHMGWKMGLYLTSDYDQSRASFKGPSTPLTWAGERAGGLYWADMLFYCLPLVFDPEFEDAARDHSVLDAPVWPAPPGRLGEPRHLRLLPRVHVRDDHPRHRLHAPPTHAGKFMHHFRPEPYTTYIHAPPTHAGKFMLYLYITTTYTHLPPSQASKVMHHLQSKPCTTVDSCIHKLIVRMNYFYRQYDITVFIRSIKFHRWFCFSGLGEHLPEHGESGDLHAATFPLPRVPETLEETQELPARRQQHGGQVTMATYILVQLSTPLPFDVNLEFIWIMLKPFIWTCTV